MGGLAGINMKAVCGSSSEFAGLGDIQQVGSSTWQHVQASGAIAKGGLVTVSTSGVAVAATTTTVGNTTGQSVAKEGGIAQYDFADGERGWVLIGPFDKNPIDESPFVVLSATGNLQSSLQYTTATAGVVDDSSTTKVLNLALTADAAGTGPVLTPCRALARITFGA